jgi:hypothetical protein
MGYSSGARFSRAKPTGSFRVFQPSTRAVASHDETLQDARKSAAYWTSAVSSTMEIQERFPSGAWITVQVVKPKSATKSAAAPKRSHATKKMEATAGFSVHTDHEDVIKDNARERFGPDYGDSAERAKRMKAGLVDAQGKITDRGWEQLNKDFRTLENNALAWLRKTFGRASDQGHDSYGDLIGGLSFDPRSSKHAHNIVVGKNERIDFNDASYGDFARSGAWKGVSTFGQNILGGHITFFDIQPPDAFEIAEETADRRKRR